MMKYLSSVLLLKTTVDINTKSTKHLTSTTVPFQFDQLPSPLRDLLLICLQVYRARDGE